RKMAVDFHWGPRMFEFMKSVLFSCSSMKWDGRWVVVALPFVTLARGRTAEGRAVVILPRVCGTIPGCLAGWGVVLRVGGLLSAGRPSASGNVSLATQLDSL